jgi:hypothetical protein
MKTIEIKICKCYTAILESTKKQQPIRESVYSRDEFIKMHGFLKTKIEEGLKLQRDGNAYLEAYNEYNIDNETEDNKKI